MQKQLSTTSRENQSLLRQSEQKTQCQSQLTHSCPDMNRAILRLLKALRLKKAPEPASQEELEAMKDLRIMMDKSSFPMAEPYEIGHMVKKLVEVMRHPKALNHDDFLSLVETYVSSLCYIRSVLIDETIRRCMIKYIFFPSPAEIWAAHEEVYQEVNSDEAYSLLVQGLKLNGAY